MSESDLQEASDEEFFFQILVPMPALFDSASDGFVHSIPITNASGF
jgi:hypothetical protein